MNNLLLKVTLNIPDAGMYGFVQAQYRFRREFLRRINFIREWIEKEALTQVQEKMKDYKGGGLDEQSI